MNDQEGSFCIENLRSSNNDTMNLLKTLHSQARFFYYTRKDTARKILNESNESKNNYFFVNPLSNMNDSGEAARHENEKSKVYALCFSNQSSENIPMWYLYSGITGEGVRIGITPKKMIGLIESIKEAYPVKGGKPDLDNPLKISEDFDVEYGWVTYLGRVRAIKKNTVYNIADENALEAFQANNYFIKNYEWNYENEFRIVFRMKTYNTEKIAVPFPKQKMVSGGGISITLAPQLKNADKELLAKELQLPVRKITNSKMQSNMNLLKRNAPSIVSNFSEFLDDLEENELNALPEMQKLICKRIDELQTTKAENENRSSPHS